MNSTDLHQDQHLITIWNSHTCIHIVQSTGNCMLSGLTSVSASRKTHLLYWVRVQQWILVKVMPSSGRPSMNRLGWSSLSIMSTMMTSSNTLLKESLMRHKVWRVRSSYKHFIHVSWNLELTDRQSQNHHPPFLFWDVWCDHDDNAASRPMTLKTFSHHYGPHAVWVWGDQSDKGLSS